MPVKISVQWAYRGAGPTRRQLQRWARQVLATRRAHAALTVRIVDIPESAALNAAWRQRSGPTNVLSFPMSGLEQIAPELLGDIVICAPVVATEAAAQGKSLAAHWAHLVIHGTLHLLGFDHVQARQARAMEALKCELVTALRSEERRVGKECA